MHPQLTFQILSANSLFGCKLSSRPQTYQVCENVNNMLHKMSFFYGIVEP